ncbi:MAG: ABC-2 transporter permease [Deltaproteobacteria bacterium]|nr:ABC-2 transporter permease [Deltaproteobacteria bacterium]
MNAMLVVARNTFRQTVREKIFYNVLFFGIGLTVLAVVVGQISFGFPDRVVRNVGLSGVSAAMDLVALLLGVGLVHQEIDRKTLFVVLTRPIRRSQYVLGRYLGLLGTLTLALVGFSAVFTTALSLSHGSFAANDAVALSMCLPEAAVIAAIGLVLSCFSTPGVGAGMGLGIWLASATTDDLVRLTERSPEAARMAAKAVYYALPSLARFNFREAATYALPVSFTDVAFSTAYAVTYVAALVALAGVVLSRRQMV